MSDLIITIIINVGDNKVGFVAKIASIEHKHRDSFKNRAFIQNFVLIFFVRTKGFRYSLLHKQLKLQFNTGLSLTQHSI